MQKRLLLARFRYMSTSMARTTPDSFFSEEEFRVSANLKDVVRSYKWPEPSSSTSTSSSSSQPEKATRNWNRLAELTHDPMIEAVSSTLNEEQKMPSTFSEAMSDSRPVVITSTESPTKIINVNDAWVKLCGYDREEALNQDLTDLLHGPDTEPVAAEALLDRLESGVDSAQGVLTNYTKQGRKFQNLVRFSTIGEDYYVAVSKEIPSYAYAF